MPNFNPNPDQARGDGTDHEMHDLAAAIREGSGKVTS